MDDIKFTQYVMLQAKIIFSHCTVVVKYYYYYHHK